MRLFFDFETDLFGWSDYRMDSLGEGDVNFSLSAQEFQHEFDKASQFNPSVQASNYEELKTIILAAFRSDQRWTIDIDDDVAFSQIRSIHYERNSDYQPIAPEYSELIKLGWTKLKNSAAVFHQLDNQGYNQKWVSPDGRTEFVYIETANGWTPALDDVNLGTYNFAPPTQATGHLTLDVFTWIMWGNSDADDGSTSVTGTFEKRLAIYDEHFPPGLILTLYSASIDGFFSLNYNLVEYGFDFVNNNIIGSKEIEFANQLDTVSDFSYIFSGDDSDEVLSISPSLDKGMNVNMRGGDDLIYASEHADYIRGDSGTDTVSFEYALTTINFQTGVSVNLTLGRGYDGFATGDSYTSIENLIGTSGADIFVGNGTLNVLEGRDGVDILYGEGGNDRLEGGNGDDELYGGSGFDLLLGGSGADVLDGGSGTDSAAYTFSDSGVTVSLLDGTATGGHAEGDSFIAIENLTGSDYADVLTGSTGNNEIRGRDGDDTIDGGSGTNQLFGGEGHDTIINGIVRGGEIYGEGGNDTISISSALSGRLSVSGGDDIDALTFSHTKQGLKVQNRSTASSTESLETMLTDMGGVSQVTYSFIGSTSQRYSIIDGWRTIYHTAYIDISIDIEEVNVHGGDRGDLILFMGGTEYSGGGGSDKFVADWSSQITAIIWDTTDGTEAMLANGVTVSEFSALHVRLGEGDDNVTGGSHANYLHGGQGNDTLTGNNAADELHGGIGDDILDGGLGDNFLFGGDDNDTLIGGTGINIMYGGDGEDIISTAVGRGGEIYGEEGNDTISVSSALSGRLSVSGGDDTDTLTFTHTKQGLKVQNRTTTSTAESLETMLTDLDGASHVSYSFIGSSTQSYSVINGWSTTYHTAYIDVSTDIEEVNVHGGDSGDLILFMNGTDYSGGAGTDKFVADWSALTVSISWDLTNTAQVTLANGVTIGEFEALHLRLGSADDYVTAVSGASYLNGGDGNDVLTGGSGGDRLLGELGNDTLFGLGGHDYIHGGMGDDLVDGGTGDNELHGGDGNDTIVGGTGVNVFFGGDGEDVISTAVGRGGEIYGEGGNDTISVSSALSGRLSVSGGDDTDTLTFTHSKQGLKVQNRTTASTSESLETMLTDMNSAAQVTYSFIGSTSQRYSVIDGWRTIYHTAYIDISTDIEEVNVVGGASGDLILFMGGTEYSGGAGTDKFVADWSAQTTALNWNATDGSETTLANGVTLSGFEYLHLRLGEGDDMITGGTYASYFHGGLGNDTLIGNNSSDELHGGLGDDILDGGLGSDILNGGEGTDFVTYARSASAVTVNLSSGSGSGAMAAGDIFTDIEGVIGSDFDDNITGSAGTNILEGMDGDDLLDGGAGADRIDGGNGIDTASYMSAVGAVWVDLVNGEASDGDTLIDIENVTGSAFDDQLTGDDGDNVLTGGNGNDTLMGGLGLDELHGGNGTDTVSYAFSLAGITLDLSGALGNTGDAADDSFFSIENIVGTSFDDVLSGDSLENALRGGAGEDTLYGLAGDDALFGGADNDTLWGSDGLDNLSGQNGDDILNGGADKDTLSGGGGVDEVYGGAGDDIIYGNAGADMLYGGGGRDIFFVDHLDTIIDGGSGYDRIFAADGSQALTLDMGTSAIEQAFGSEFGDTFDGSSSLSFIKVFGGDGGDIFTGSDFGDRMYGEAGDDMMTGGLGNDRFFFDFGDGHDVITDFGSAGRDRIDLKAAGITNISELTISQLGGDTLIEYGADSILLQSVDIATVNRFDFVFAPAVADADMMDFI